MSNKESQLKSYIVTVMCRAEGSTRDAEYTEKREVSVSAYNENHALSKAENCLWGDNYAGYRVNEARLCEIPVTDCYYQ